MSSRRKSPPTRPLLERFLEKVRIAGDDECWIWTGARTKAGYGQVYVKPGGREYVHRVAYKLWIGPLPDDLQIDHVKSRGCVSRLCVNPRHLEPVTNATNSRRGARSKLTDADVRAIRRAQGSLRAIGREFGVSHCTVLRVKRLATDDWANPNAPSNGGNL